MDKVSFPNFQSDIELDRVKDIILLSRMPTSVDSGYEGYFDPRLKNKGWFMCSAMLIEWDSTKAWAERIVAGEIHGKVWDLQSSESQHIILG